MSVPSCWVGLDAGEDRTNFCVVDESGSPISQGDCASTIAEVDDRLRPFIAGRDSLIGIEAGCGGLLARKLRSLGHNVLILETRKTRRLLEIRRNKNDENDARGIADIVRLARHGYAESHLKSLAVQQLRTKLKLRHRILIQKNVIEGIARSLFRLNGGRPPRAILAKSLRADAEAEAHRIRVEEGIDLFDDLEPLLQLSDSLRTHLRAYDRWLAATVKRNELCCRFLAIPGVGPVCALSFVTAVEDPNRFRRSSDVAAYLGLTPRLFESGDRKVMGRISKMGNTLTRSHLVLAGRSMLKTRKQSSALQKWGQQLRARIGFGKAAVAAARKMTTIMHAMWTNGTEFDPEGRASR